MQKLFLEMLDVMDAAFQGYAAALPKPERVQQGHGWVYRFKDKDVYRVNPIFS